MASIPNYPAVVINEIDLSTRITNGNITSYGAIAINSEWGPAEQINLINTEKTLVDTFGKPNSDTYLDFFVATNFLSYSSSLQVVRVIDTAAKNAVAGGALGNTAIQIKNSEDFTIVTTTANNGLWIAKYPGSKGNSIFVTACDSGVDLGVKVDYTSNNIGGSGSWSDYVNTIPGTSTHASSMYGSKDEVHILVFDSLGQFTGSAGTLLEKFEYVSLAKNAKKEDGTNNYYKDVINQQSSYIWAGSPSLFNSNNNSLISDTFTPWTSNTNGTSVSLTNGVDVTANNVAMYINGYELFADKKTVDVSHFIAPTSNVSIIQSLITIAENRGDSIVFVSPNWSMVQPGQTQAAIANNIVVGKSLIGVSSSYYFADGNWKYQYDKYNDVNRWIPCNGDVAGLKAQAETSNDAWWNGSGYTRGLLKNTIKLAWNPKDTYMGLIYKASVNPIIAEGGSFILLGDKTGLTKPSSFDRINVRSLFNTLKTQISGYLKYGLFDFNDEFTRAQLTSHVEVYLQSVKSRRGIEAFQVVCDLTNNDGQVRDSNQLVMDVYIKPTKSINWIILNMVNVGSSVSFNEVIGKF